MDDAKTTATRVDRWGYQLRTSSDACVVAIDAYYDQVLSYGRNRAIILDAPANDPACVLGNALAAHFLCSKDLPKASSLLVSAAAALKNATSYEKAVYEAIILLVGDGRDEEEALSRHFELVKEYPKDLVSLKRAQILCFYMGQPHHSLNLVEKALPHNQGQSFIYGMLAFPLLELGRMAEAKSVARRGWEINRFDIWSQHCLCHVLQYECHFNEAVEFMESCSSTWRSCSSFMYTHNWWHVAVCYLEGNAPLRKVLKVYDEQIWKELQRNYSDRAEVFVNALGLLLQLDVRDQMDVMKDRLLLAAETLKDKSMWHVEWLLDILSLWTLARAKESLKAEELLNSIKSRNSFLKKQNVMQRATQLAEATYEYGRGNHHKVVDILGPDFDAIDFKMIGASDEQLDVFNEIWYNVLLNTGNASKAIDLIEKQLKKRVGCPYLWRLLEKAYGIAGKGDAAMAAEKAKALEISYFN
ncbi:tetratricopeptide repeat protein 38 isoform X1 [Dendrobium catenatum]|uniref:tetratricopeptide repeat protein 38 isoform X1 n=1 Tax=Dendrobium catenatum TaxID=906689 RepID=UPI0009F1AF53|nr:tetratricopeptide repeat protein 38 isoform X1 [Dendrobium catenatum]